MLEAIRADVMEQKLKIPDFDHARAAKGLQRILREAALADVAANPAGDVVRREASEAHVTGADFPDDRAIGVLAADGPGDDRLIVHLRIVEEGAGQVAAMEADGLVRIVAVVVV